MSYPLAWLTLPRPFKQIVDWLAVAVAVWVLITAVSAIGGGFKLATGDQAGELFQFAANPIIGLMIGVLATVLTQSSSTTTSITVGMVAGGLPIEIAIPVLFGANIGTTVTSTLVSFGMAGDREMFRRAFAAASVHDMYNILALLIFFPRSAVSEAGYAPAPSSSASASASSSSQNGGGSSTSVGPASTSLPATLSVPRVAPASDTAALRAMPMPAGLP